MAFKDMLCHTIQVRKREGEKYEGGMSTPIYVDSDPVLVRISSLGYKDMQFVDKVRESHTMIYKMHTLPGANIHLHDTVVYDGRAYTVIHEYPVYGRNEMHHKKFYIKHVE